MNLFYREQLKCFPETLGGVWFGLVWFLFPFSVDVFSLLTEIMPHFFSCFQYFIKEMVKTAQSCFHHFFHKVLKTENKIKMR